MACNLGPNKAFFFLRVMMIPHLKWYSNKALYISILL